MQAVIPEGFFSVAELSGGDLCQQLYSGKGIELVDQCVLVVGISRGGVGVLLTLVVEVAAAIASATIELVVPDAQRKDEPFGFCLASGGPGELVCLDSFYIGNLKGVGKVYQLTAIDVFTRFAVVAIVLGTPTGAMTARFIHQALGLYRRHGVKVRAILTDNGPEYIAGTFVDALAAKTPIE